MNCNTNHHFKSIITPAVALGVFTLVLLVALLISGFATTTHFDHTRTKIFLYCLTSMGVVITFLFYYSVVQLQASQQRIIILQMTSNITKMLTKDIHDQLYKVSNKVPNFVMSLYPLQHNMKDCINNDDIITPENCMIQFKLSYKIFSLWQELLLCLPFLDMEPTAYICICLQNAHSSYLKEQWNIYKYDFNCKTQTFGDLLFSYASKIKKQTPQSYTNMVKKMQKNKTFMSLLY